MYHQNPLKDMNTNITSARKSLWIIHDLEQRSTTKNLIENYKTIKPLR